MQLVWHRMQTENAELHARSRPTRSGLRGLLVTARAAIALIASAFWTASPTRELAEEPQ
jgi:hypothetical protein